MEFGPSKAWIEVKKPKAPGANTRFKSKLSIAASRVPCSNSILTQVDQKYRSGTLMTSPGNTGTDADIGYSRISVWPRRWI